MVWFGCLHQPQGIDTRCRCVTIFIELQWDSPHFNHVCLAGGVFFVGWHVLVGGLEREFYDFPYVGNVIIPTDELIFFRGVGWNHQPVMLYLYIIPSYITTVIGIITNHQPLCFHWLHHVPPWQGTVTTVTPVAAAPAAPAAPAAASSDELILVHIISIGEANWASVDDFWSFWRWAIKNG